MNKKADRQADESSAFEILRLTLRKLYHGRTKAAIRFQTAVMVVDFIIIAFFVASPMLRNGPAYLWIDYTVAAILTVDIVARGLAASDFWRWLRKFTIIVDLFILLTLLMPATLANLGFLRILRLWTLSTSGVLWRPIARRGYGDWRETGRAVVNLATFLFIASGFVYTSFFRDSAGLEGYVDAIYFTVATVTTTGFGDIVLEGVWGKLTAIVTMIIGISLFVRLAQALFRPTKVQFPCPQCGLQRHDPDAVHCKACGHLLNIPDHDN
ncbi:ion channel [Mesorhizobium xinjiangense]|uniref:ion channel n=1 Tax=Mesorhizobium xinjiangense TaxID=2678685 RepID=UPI0012ED71F0|nr:ion channel [Mesorhizobium xinjiangense]